MSSAHISETRLMSRGNLSQKSLLDVVKREDLVENSEFLETLVVAVPKCVRLPDLRQPADESETSRRTGKASTSA